MTREKGKAFAVKKLFFKLLRLGLYVLTIFIVLFAAAFWWASTAFETPASYDDTRYVVIESGAGLNGIAQVLEREGVVENPYIFVFGTLVRHAQGDLKAGEYELSPHMSPKDIMRQMQAGKIFPRRVTIPEGLTSREIVEILKAVPFLAGEPQTIPPEGSLFPSTYDIKRGETREAVLARMGADMKAFLAAAWAARGAEPLIKTPEEALVLASIVEKETGKPEERARIAGVFLNRLRTGMPLQSDPTVIYGLTKGAPERAGMGPLGRRLLSKDLDTPSPYNTYLNKGLPPTPICNVGKAALEAVLHPESHAYLYFVADGTGGHVFARTLAEHNQNVAQWRKMRE